MEQLELFLLILVFSHVYAIIPPQDSCTLATEDCAIIQEAGENMRSLSSVTVDNLQISIFSNAADPAEEDPVTIEAEGSMVWADSHLNLDLYIYLTRIVFYTDELHLVVVDDTLFNVDIASGEADELEFELDVPGLPSLRVPGVEWSGSDGEYTVEIETTRYLSTPAVFTFAIDLLESSGNNVDTLPLYEQLDGFLETLSESQEPYTITYVIEDGFITRVDSIVHLPMEVIGYEEIVEFKMSVELSNHNGDVTIEPPEDVSAEVQ